MCIRDSSYASKAGYDPLRQKIRDYQKEALSGTGVTWFDMVPYTKNLTRQADGVHFTTAAYKNWGEELLKKQPLSGIRG